METIKKEIRKILDDGSAIFAGLVTFSRTKTMTLSGFIGIWVISFFADTGFRTLVQQHHNPLFDQLFSFFHWYGKGYLSLAVIAAFYIGAWLRTGTNWRSVGTGLFEAFAFSGIIVTILKSLFGRWRPYAEHGNFSFVFLTLGPNEHLSLPSGDVATAFAMSAILAGMIDNKFWKWMWYVIAAITALGRIYHDQHWLSDTIFAAGISVWIGTFLVKRANTHS